MKKLILLLICLFFVTGCYNYNDLNKISISSSMFIDYIDNNYIIKIESLRKDEHEIISGKGKTITETLKLINNKNKLDIYYNHLNAVVITENVNLKDILEYFMRNPNINNNFYLVFTEEDDIYDNKITNFGEHIYDICSNNKYDDFFNITKYYINNYRDIMLPILKNKEINSLALYKDNKFKLKSNKIDIINILLDNPNSVITAKCDDNHFTIKTNDLNITYNIKNNITINIDLYASLNEYTCKYNTLETKNILKLESIMNKHIEKEIKNNIKLLNNNEIDLLGINNKINNKYKKIDKQFYNYEYKINVNTHINKKGLLLK